MLKILRSKFAPIERDVQWKSNSAREVFVIISYKGVMIFLQVLYCWTSFSNDIKLSSIPKLNIRQENINMSQFISCKYRCKLPLPAKISETFQPLGPDGSPTHHFRALYYCAHSYADGCKWMCGWESGCRWGFGQSRDEHDS